MTTISENLQTLNEAKAAIKTAIENKGVDMTDVPFAQYAEKIESMSTLKDYGTATRSVGHLFYYKDVTNEEAAQLIQYETTQNVTNFQSMFSYATSITRPPLFYIGSTVYAANLFSNTKIEIIDGYDFRGVYNATKFVDNCANLKEIWIKNIKVDIQVGSGETWGHLLTEESLIHLVKELRDTGSAKTLTVSTPSLEKLSSVYVRTIDITDEMRAEDDLIDEKLPFEVCESTDEGAMLITDYVALKNWNLAEGGA